MDTIAGTGRPPSFVLALIARLPDDSLTAALRLGGRDHFGWGVTRHILADIYDATNLTTRAAGNWRDKAPDIPQWPRPNVPTDGAATEKKKRTVEDIYNLFLQAKGGPH